MAWTLHEAEAIGRIEEKIDQVLVSVADHESRIRANERFHYKLIGAALAMSCVITLIGWQLT